MSAISDWAKALYEQLQDCPNNETGWKICEEAGQHLADETEIRVLKDVRSWPEAGAKKK